MMDVAVSRPSDHAVPDELSSLARESLGSCHAALLEARQNVLAGRDPTAIHALRVALRRLRAALSLFKQTLPDDIARALRGDAKQLADACGPTRDLDVFLAGTLVHLEERLADRPGMTGESRAWRAAALRLRRIRHDAVRDLLASDVFAVFDLRLAGLCAGPAVRLPAEIVPPFPPGPVDFARNELRRRHRRLRRKLEHIGDLDAAERHALRLQVKRQRYTASFLAHLFDRKDANAYIRAATDLQDAMGLANDRAVASRVVADIRAAAQKPGGLDWIAGVLDGVLAAWAPSHGEDDRAVARAARRFAKAPRFWRHRRRKRNGDAR